MGMAPNRHPLVEILLQSFPLCPPRATAESVQSGDRKQLVALIFVPAVFTEPRVVRNKSVKVSAVGRLSPPDTVFSLCCGTQIRLPHRAAMMRARFRNNLFDGSRTLLVTNLRLRLTY